MKISQEFWEETYKKNIASMIGVCYRYVHNRQIAEDLAQDTFLTIMNKIDSYKGLGKFEAWIRRITINTVLQYLKKQKKFNANEIELHRIDRQPQFMDEDEIPQKNFSKEELLDAIQCLPEHHRLVFNLYVIDKLTHKEIGSKLDISPGTSKSHLARARKKLKVILHDSSENRKRSILLLISIKLFGVDRLYTRQFRHFKMQPCSYPRFDKISWELTKVPRFMSLVTKVSVFISAASVIGIVTVFTLSSLKPQHTYESSDEEKHQLLDSNTNDNSSIDSNQISGMHDKIPEKRRVDSVIKNSPVVIKKKILKKKIIVLRDTLELNEP